MYEYDNNYYLIQYMSAIIIIFGLLFYDGRMIKLKKNTNYYYTSISHKILYNMISTS